MRAFDEELEEEPTVDPDGVWQSKVETDTETETEGSETDEHELGMGMGMGMGMGRDAAEADSAEAERGGADSRSLGGRARGANGRPRVGGGGGAGDSGRRQSIPPRQLALMTKFLAGLGIGAKDFEQLYAQVEWVVLQPQQMLFAEGDADDSLYIVIAGTLGLFRHLDDELVLIREFRPVRSAQLVTTEHRQTHTYIHTHTDTHTYMHTHARTRTNISSKSVLTAPNTYILTIHACIRTN